MRGKIAAVGVLALAIPFVALWEGYVPQTYVDVVGVPTVCYGYAGADVTRETTLTRAQCDALLTVEVWETYKGLMACIKRPLKDHEAAALTSWAYNVGVGAACGSTLVRKLNRGEEFCSELDRWVYAKGKRLSGLVARRAKERAMCEGRM